MSKTAAARLSLTALETRDLMSVSLVSVAHEGTTDVLNVRTDNASTSVELRVVGTGVQVRNTSSGWTSSVYYGVDRVDFVGGAGHDRFVTHHPTLPVRAWGQGGDDYLEGYNGSDRLMGGAGNDVLCGYGGNDMIWGEDNTDIIYGMDGNDQLMGGNGNDFLYGGNDSDKLWGEAGADYFQGGAGWDTFTTDASDRMQQRGSNGLGLMDGPSVFDAGVAFVGAVLGTAWNQANQQTINNGGYNGGTGPVAQVGVVMITEFDPNATSDPLNCLSGGFDPYAVTGTVDVIAAGQLAVYVDNG